MMRDKVNNVLNNNRVSERIKKFEALMDKRFPELNIKAPQNLKTPPVGRGL